MPINQFCCFHTSWYIRVVHKVNDVHSPWFCFVAIHLSSDMVHWPHLWFGKIAHLQQYREYNLRSPQTKISTLRHPKYSGYVVSSHLICQTGSNIETRWKTLDVAWETISCHYEGSSYIYNLYTVECRYNAVQHYIHSYGSWGRISIRCRIHACAGNAENVFPATDFKENH